MALFGRLAGCVMMPRAQGAGMELISCARNGSKLTTLSVADLTGLQDLSGLCVTRKSTNLMDPSRIAAIHVELSANNKCCRPTLLSIEPGMANYHGRVRCAYQSIAAHCGNKSCHRIVLVRAAYPTRLDGSGFW